LVPRKGQDALIRALPRIRQRVPGARLVLVGGGPDERRLRRLTTACGVADAVVFAGRVPAADLPAHYAAADVFGMPCRTHAGGLDVEGLGIAALEAAATGLPVVIGDSGGAPETVRDGMTGHVLSGRDVTALADTLAALLGDPVRANTMGAAGRAWMQQAWSWPDRVGYLRHLLIGGPAPTSCGPGAAATPARGARQADWRTPE
jgi:phosphatidylinositol alpha-1,6-mannosyltransferase